MLWYEFDNDCNFAENLATKKQFVTELLEFPTAWVVLIARNKTQFFNASKANENINLSLSRRKLLPLSSTSWIVVTKKQENHKEFFNICFMITARIKMITLTWMMKTITDIMITTTCMHDNRSEYDDKPFLYDDTPQNN